MRIVLNYLKVSRVTEELDLSVCVLRFTEQEPKCGNYRKQFQLSVTTTTISLTHSLRNKAGPSLQALKRKQPDKKEQILYDFPLFKIYKTNKFIETRS